MVNQHVQFRVDRIRNREVARGTEVLYWSQSSKGNYSKIHDPIEMKFVSCTTAGDDETTCEVWSWLDKKCRSSSRNRRFVIEIKSSKDNNSIALGLTEMKCVSRTTACDSETTCEVRSWSDKKCRSSSRNRRVLLKIKSSKGNNSITLGPTETKFVSRTTEGDDETTCEVWS